jgi:F-type H+-transporting ATPase subunit epsilon
MLPDKLTLEIATPERRVLIETVDEVVLPGKLGYLGVLPGHAPLLTSLSVGELMYRRGSDRKYLAMAWGFAEILPTRVIVLADVAERAEEIDLDRAQAKKSEVEARMKSPDPSFDMNAASVSLQKAVIRIQVAHKKTG